MREDQCLAFTNSLMTSNSVTKPKIVFLFGLIQSFYLVKIKSLYLFLIQFFIWFNTVTSTRGETELSSIWAILNFKDNFAYHVKT